MVWKCSTCHGEEYNICISCVLEYIKTGTDLNEKDAEGNTALHYVEPENAHIAELLRKSGAKDLQNNKGDYPPTARVERAERAERSAPVEPGRPKGGYTINEEKMLLERPGKTSIPYILKKGTIEILNPKSMRYVLLTGKIGQGVIAN